jgi:hypothetical protein
MNQITLPSGTVLSYGNEDFPIICVGKSFPATTNLKGSKDGVHYFTIMWINGASIPIANSTYDESERDRNYLLKVLNNKSNTNIAS